MKIRSHCGVLAAATFASSTLCLPSPSLASGFAIPAQSGSAAGNAFAGTAEAEDSSVLWFNPAGLARIDGTNVVLAGNLIKPSFKFGNTGSTGVFGFTGSGDGGDGGHLALVPETYAATTIGNGWHVGIGVNAPFGLKTDYESGWRGRFSAERSEVKSYNINPSLAYKITDMLSLGVGVDWQRFTAKLTNFAGPLGDAALDAADSSWGYDAGAMLDLTKNARVGISYRSAIAYRLHGSANFSGGGGIFNSSIRTELTVPESLSVNGFLATNSPWELMANATWTRWSRLQSLTVVRTSASALGAAGSTLSVLPFNWRDTYFLAVGAGYSLDENWKLQFGIAHDSAASNDVTRSPRLPDQSRTQCSVGARYRMTKSGTLDVAYSHDFIKDASIDTATVGAPGRLVGTFKNYADVLSAQYSYRY